MDAREPTMSIIICKQPFEVEQPFSTHLILTNPESWKYLADWPLVLRPFAGLHSKFRQHFVSIPRRNFCDQFALDTDSCYPPVKWKVEQQNEWSANESISMGLTFSYAPFEVGEVDWLLSSIDVSFATAIDVSSCVIVVVATSAVASTPCANVFSILKNSSSRCFFYARKLMSRSEYYNEFEAQSFWLNLHVPMREYWPLNPE